MSKVTLTLEQLKKEETRAEKWNKARQRLNRAGEKYSMAKYKDISLMHAVIVGALTTKVEPEVLEEVASTLENWAKELKEWEEERRG